MTCSRHQKTYEEYPEKIYLKYPRKGKKKAALVAIRRAIFRITKSNGVFSNAAAGWLFHRVCEFASSIQGSQKPDPKTGKDYRPLATTFFDNERYSDPIEIWGIPKEPPRDRSEVTREKFQREHEEFRAGLNDERERLEGIPPDEIPGMIEVIRANAHPTMRGCYENPDPFENRWLGTAILEMRDEMKGETG